MLAAQLGRLTGQAGVLPETAMGARISWPANAAKENAQDGLLRKQAGMEQRIPKAARRIDALRVVHADAHIGAGQVEAFVHILLAADTLEEMASAIV